MTDEPRVQLRHIRAMKLCAHGARQWCARYGVSWEQLRGDGVPCSVAEATGDPWGIKAAQLAREEAESGG